MGDILIELRDLPRNGSDCGDDSDHHKTHAGAHEVGQERAP